MSEPAVYKRRTLAQTVRFSGVGLHSGVPVDVVVRPGDQGIGFWVDGRRTPADPGQVTNTVRCTQLAGPVATVEHIMAAFAGLEITDAEVELSSHELPAMDGSAGPYVEALVAGGTEPLPGGWIERPFARVFVQEKSCKLGISAGHGVWRYTFACGDRWPVTQIFETKDVTADFASQIAPARTFGFEEEIPELIERGLARGLDLEKALVLGAGGYNNAERFSDEPARHKLLDAIGDIYLAGVPVRTLNASFERTGHRAHVLAAQRLSAAVTFVRS